MTSPKRAATTARARTATGNKSRAGTATDRQGEVKKAYQRKSGANLRCPHPRLPLTQRFQKAYQRISGGNQAQTFSFLLAVLLLAFH